VTDPVLVHPAVARRQFMEYAAGEIDNGNLAHGALLIALEDQPQLDLLPWESALEDLTERVRRRVTPGEPDVFRLGHLHAEMFDRDGYRGDSENYYDPRNAWLSDVIARRRGLPISLSVIFLHVAGRLGLHAAGVGLPGHFLVKVQFELSEVYVDPFNGGTTLTMPEIAELLRDMSGGRLALSSDYLRAWSGRQILMRLLANLVNMHTMRGEERRAAAARERMELLGAAAGDPLLSS
jgi:regulator of sirC expression with transglutaminase-like and TPR domain